MMNQAWLSGRTGFSLKMLRQIALSLLFALGASLAYAVDPVAERAWVEDPSGSMTLAQVMAAPQKPLDGRYFGQGFSASAFWIRLRIDPGSWPDAPQDQKLVIRLKPFNVDEFQLHDPLSPRGVVRYTGDRHTWSNDVYQSPNNHFLVPLGDAPRDIWLRLKTTTSTFSSIEVLDLGAARSADARQWVWSLAYLCVLMICMGWGILSWLNSRDRLVKLYVIRELFIIAYAMTALGVWRMVDADLLTPAWIDELTNWGFFLVVLVMVWFDIHFLREFKPNPHLIKVLYGFLFVFIGEWALGVAGYFGWVLKIHAYVLTLCFVAVFITAASTRAWSGSPPQERPVISKPVLVGFYLFVLLTGVWNRLITMGAVPSAIDAWDLLMLYPLAGSVMMMAILHLRAQQQSRKQQESQWRIVLAERSAKEEKSKRQEHQRLLAMLGHELRNPLAAVNFLADSHTHEGRQIRRAVQDMNLVLERCVQAEQFDDGGFKPQLDAVDLPGLVQELSQRIPPERMLLRVHDVPRRLRTDPVLLAIVLGNLLDNALKYSLEASVVAVDVEWLASESPPVVRFQVSNVPGPAGMPDAQKLFEKYYRSPAAHHQVGSGLGLYLVSGLAKVLGGSIAYRPSAEGDVRRVIFEVKLPADPLAIH